MRGSPPPGSQGPRPGGYDENNSSGRQYNGGPMSPGPRPNASVSRKIVSSDPNATYMPEPSPNSSLWQGAIRSTVLPAVSVESALASAASERLWSGNIGRLWTSEIASTAGDILFSVGVVIWFLQISGKFNDVVGLLLVIAIPPVLVSIFGGSLAGLKDTRRLLTVLGILRIALALLFILMHFETIIPVVFLLAFGLSLSSSMRHAVRRGTIAHTVAIRARATLASGEQIAAGVLAVAGPAITTLLYILNGERIFAIAVGAATCYFLTLTGETGAQPLPDSILYQKPKSDSIKIESAWEDEQDSPATPNATPTQVWELLAPPNARAAVADVNQGLQVIGSSSHATTAFLLITLVAFIGGIVAALQPFYVAIKLHQAPFMLGLLLTAAGLGATIASAIIVEIRHAGEGFLVFGIIACGVSLIELPRARDINQTLIIIAVLGAANIFAIRGGQMTIMRHLLPEGQRAASAALQLGGAVLSLLGIVAALVVMTGLAFANRKTLLPPVGLTNTLAIGGMSLVIAGVVAVVILVIPNRVSLVVPEEDELAAIPADETAWDEEESAEYSQYTGTYTAESSSYTAYTGEYSSYSDEYEAPQRPRQRYTEDDDEFDDSRPQRRR